MTAADDYDELSAWTLSRGDQGFIHQHALCAWKAQTADEKSKPIEVMFALAGLYLHLEKGMSGRDVQRAHATMARSKEPWPRLQLPSFRGKMTVSDVLSAPEGDERAEAIHRWAASVWEAFSESRRAVIDVVKRTLGG